jgi:hypothetical protein
LVKLVEFIVDVYKTDENKRLVTVVVRPGCDSGGDCDNVTFFDASHPLVSVYLFYLFVALLLSLLAMLSLSAALLALPALLALLLALLFLFRLLGLLECLGTAREHHS